MAPKAYSHYYSPYDMKTGSARIPRTSFRRRVGEELCFLAIQLVTIAPIACFAIQTGTSLAAMTDEFLFYSHGSFLYLPGNLWSSPVYTTPYLTDRPVKSAASVP